MNEITQTTNTPTQHKHINRCELMMEQKQPQQIRNPSEGKGAALHLFLCLWQQWKNQIASHL